MSEHGAAQVGDGGYYNAGVWALVQKGLQPFSSANLLSSVNEEGHISTDLTISEAIFSYDSESMDMESEVTYPLSFIVSVQRSNGAEVLTFTNLTSDSLSLYQDPKNAGAVFQVPFSEFDCYGCNE